MKLNDKKELRARRSHLVALLEDRGYRPTTRRMAIASFLEQKHGGFTIEGLCKEMPSVGRATLYRTIKLFLEVGIVCRVSTVDGARVYSLSRVDHRHHHSVCVECGAVEEFQAATVDRVLNAVSAEFRGQVVDHLLELYVDCGDCPPDDDDE